VTLLALVSLMLPEIPQVLCHLEHLLVLQVL
jgi:hypothetical protein